MKKNISLVIFTISLCFLLTSCVSLDKKYVTQQKFGLSVAPAKPIGKKNEKILEIYYPEIGSQFAGSNFIYRSDELQYTSDYYNTFFISPVEQIYKNELKYLQSSELFKYISPNVAPLKPNYILKTYVSELYSDYRNGASPKAVMTIQFVLIDTTTLTPKIIFNKTLSKNQPLTQKTSNALVTAWNQELTSILRQLSFLIQKNI